METRLISELRPHPLNAEIYGDGCDADLRDSIQSKGILTPLLVTSVQSDIGANVIISGHRRFNAAQMAGVTQIPVIVSTLTAAIDIEEAILTTNKQRQKTNEQIGREARKLLAIEEIRARERQREAGQRYGENHRRQEVMESVPQPLVHGNGVARDIVGEKLGVSGRTAERAVRVVDAIDTLTAHGYCESAADLRETLNQNITAAYQAAAPIYGETRAAHTQAVQEVTTHAVLQDDAKIHVQIEARARELTKQKLADIEAQKAKPHVAKNSGNNEWYTPAPYLDAAREVMGGIDLDPASSAIANETVRAFRYFDITQDGLLQGWSGRVWLNPPYSSDLIIQFCEKLVDSLPAIDEAIVLVNNATETAWFGILAGSASAIVFPRGRVRFYGVDGEKGAPLQGQACLYFGKQPERFLMVFKRFGWGAVL